MARRRRAGRNDAWSVILSGGEGERTRPFIEQWLGYHKPKQYCAFVGRRSLFQHTVDRADRTASPERRVAVVAEGHRQVVVAQLQGRTPGTVVHQPRNCGTAAGVFLGLSYVRARAPDAVVTIFPSDHFVHPEDRFARAVEQARQLARKQEERLVLLGVRPDGPESEYGWIHCGTACERANGFGARNVAGFVEKPSRGEAENALARGALWNTLIVTGRLTAFNRLGRRLLPEVLGIFDELVPAVGGCEEQRRLERIYRRMPVLDFSSHLLQKCPESLVVLELSDVTWSDWGCPERIRGTLRAIGREPVFVKGCDHPGMTSERTSSRRPLDGDLHRERALRR